MDGLSMLESFVSTASDLHRQGRSTEEILARLRADGASIIDCVKVVRSVYAVRLGVAKEIVDGSRAWADARDANSRLRDRIEEIVDQLD